MQNGMLMHSQNGIFSNVFPVIIRKDNTMKICGCGQAKSVPGLISSVGLCQKHFDMLFYGTGEERRLARGYMQAVNMTAAAWKQHKILNKL